MQAECTNCTTAAHVQVADIAKLGLAVTATFAIMWAPFLGRTSDFLQVLHRIVPVRRGLYEDYVANFWCTTSLAIKWRSLFSQQVSSACQIYRATCGGPSFKQLTSSHRILMRCCVSCHRTLS